MGKAADWFGEAEREGIALEILVSAKREGSKVAAHCPFHAERTPGGAFFYNPSDDVGHCHSCGQASDLIGVWCALQGRSFDDADGFRDFAERYAPEHAAKGGRRRTETKPRPAPRGWQPREYGLPPELWRKKAAKFLAGCVEALEQEPAVQEQLAAWGIPMDVARACRLGWNPSDTFRPRISWGISEDPAARKIWLPAGLVIPFAVGGEVVKLRVRRPSPETGPEWARADRYWNVKGSCGRVSLYGRPETPVWVVVESERDAAMLWGVGRGIGVGAVGLGSVSARPDGEAAQVLRRAELILNALDFDERGYEHTVKFWEKEFPNSIRWPVPPAYGQEGEGKRLKDPGDAVAAGLDIRQWLLAGMPAYARRAAEQHVRRIRRDGPPSSPAPTASPAAHAQPAPPRAASAPAPAQSSPLPSWMHPFTDAQLAECLGPMHADVLDLCGLLTAYAAAPAVLVGRGEERGIVLTVPDSVWFGGADPAGFWRLRTLFFESCRDAVLFLARPEELRAARGAAGLHGVSDRDGDWAMLVKSDDGALSYVGWRRLEHWS